jgi:L-aspartate oxidase
MGKDVGWLFAPSSSCGEFMISPFPPTSWGGIDDVVIVGGGLAGLFCALKLAPRPVTIISGGPIGEGPSSIWAQGGIAAAIGAGDTIESHVADTLTAGAGLADERVARFMVVEAADRLDDLQRFGVVFDRDPDGALKLSRDSTHSQRRIVRVRGDMAGAAIMSALVAAVRRTPSIRVMEGYVAEQLRAEDHYVTGLVARDRRGGLSDRLHFSTRAIVLASGGIGHLYAITTNAPEARGEGLAIAARAGALIADPEFVQFHPTAVDIGRDPAPLATEALRAEGAIIVDQRGHRFMLDRHGDAELAPREVVARAVHEYRASGRGAFLDCRLLAADFAERYPTLHAACIEAGIDRREQPIPIAPAAHYHMGGIHVDGVGRSTLDGLWACGEVASTGADGANRLASNSLLEAVAYAGRVAQDIHGLLPNHRMTRWSGSEDGELPFEPVDDGEAIGALRATMSRHVGVVRDRSGLIEALSTIERLSERVHGPQVRNALVTAKLVTAAALKRQESRGSHYRSDYPLPDPDLAVRTFMTLGEAEAISASAPATTATLLRLAS